MRDFLATAGVCLGMLVLLFGTLGWIGWYRAGVQAGVYEREGIQITQWEVFVGSKPGERAIRIVEPK
jgi:hypothetical protein